MRYGVCFMNRFFIFFSFLMISTFGFYSQAFAGGDCTLCGDKAGSTPTLQCKAGHEVHSDCLANQVNSTDITSQKQAKEIQTHGLRCYGNNGKCQEKLSLQDAERLLNGTQEFKNLTTRLSSAQSCMNIDSGSSASGSGSSSSSSASSSSAGDSQAKKVREFQNQIVEAFNMCCPNSVCGGILAPVEGCNAATCESCNTRFCYLCLHPEADNTANHAHARAHSGNYWEHRDGYTGLVPAAGQDYQEFEEYDVQENHPQHGKRKVKVRKPYKYTDRFHWEIVRGKLDALFENESDSQAKTKAVQALEPLLKKEKMWPLPVGKEIDHWVNAVSHDPSLDPRNRIALLQNELVFQTAKQKQLAKHPTTESAKAENLVRSETLKGALLSLQAPVLTSLDVGAHLANQPNQNNHITPVMEGHEDERVNALRAQLQQESPQFFALGGNDGRLYRITDPEPNPARQVAPFVLSDTAPRKMNHKEAAGWDENGVHHPGYCESIGATLPTKQQLEALGRAMSPNGRYDQNAIAGMSETFVWSLSVHPNYPDFAFYFDGYFGFVGYGYRDFGKSVRCVRPAVAW
jgi:hypothetical protein